MTVTYFSAGQVIGRSFSTFFSNLGGFLPTIVVASVPIIVVAWLIKVSQDNLLGVVCSFVVVEAELFRDPQAEQLVASCARFESELLIVLESGLFLTFAFVKGRHGSSRSRERRVYLSFSM